MSNANYQPPAGWTSPTEAIPATDSLAADGDPNEDTLKATIDRARTMLDEAGDLKAPGVAFADKIEVVRLLHWRAVDAVRASYDGARTSLDIVRRQTEQDGRTAGLAASVVEARFREAAERTRATLRAEVITDTAPKMLAAADEARSAGMIFKGAIDLAAVKAYGPSALGRKVSIDDLSTADALERQIRTYEPRHVMEMFEAMISAGDAEEIARFIDAARVYATEIAQMPPPRIQQRFSGGSRERIAEEARTTAVRILDRIQKWKKDNEPREIGVARAANSVLLDAFREACGVHGRYLASIESFFQQGGAASLDDQLAIDPNFVSRYASGKFKLPGWSPIVMRDSGGRPIRAKDPQAKKLGGR